MPPDRPFYPQADTDLSFEVLADARRLMPDGALIGGWGTWVRLRTLPSHDIDMIVSDADVVTVRERTEDLSESTHLDGRKWRATLRGIHLELYVPYQSRLGQRLRLRVEDLAGRVENVDGWNVLDTASHLATKLAALLDRPDSLPGTKDRAEATALLLDLHASPSLLAETLAGASELGPNALAAAVDDAFRYIDEGLATRKERTALRAARKSCLDALHAA